MTVVFDLDGTLIDSEEVIRASYREAGAEPPPDFLSLGHHDWLQGPVRDDVHKRKNDAYLRRLRAGEFSLLPAWHTAKLLAEGGFRTAILTGAPAGTVTALQSVLTPWPFKRAVTGQTPAMKTMWLGGIPEGGVYVDDQEHVNMPPGWKFVHYTRRQSANELFSEVTA